MSKRILSGVLALMMALCFGTALGENVKQERVYAVMNADGTLTSLTDMIRLENREGLDTLTDRTCLEEIENVGGDETFTLEGETLTWQAKGQDITYRGTSGRAPLVKPVVRLTLDGEEIPASALKEGTGRAEIRVTCAETESRPCLTLSVLLLPEEGISHLETENAAVITLAGRKAVVGWTAPGTEKSLGLPDSFTLRFDADHPSLEWMMTVASGDPAAVLSREAEKNLGADPRTEAETLMTLLSAMEKGETLPETQGLTAQIPGEVNGLNEGLTSLNDGAKALADGTKDLAEGAKQVDEGAALLEAGVTQVSMGSGTLKAGAETLSTGLTTLSGSSATLNAGAKTIFDAVLKTANDQIAASGLAAAGITLPELTAENYNQVLSAVIEKMGKAEAFSAARESLTALLTQLTQAETFVTGLAAYTAGVDQAAAGAGELSAGAAALDTGITSLSAGAGELATGATALHTGADQVHTGAQTLYESGTQALKDSLTGAEKSLAENIKTLMTEKLLPLTNALGAAGDNAETAGYDLRPEGMETVTVYIIRTDLK